MADLADDVARFWDAYDSVLERVQPTWWGSVVADGRFPRVWDTNYARVETADPSLSLEEVDAALTPVLEEVSAVAFHVVMFRPETTTRLLSELTDRGDRPSWDIVMTYEGTETTHGSALVEELRVDDGLWAGVAASLPSFGVTEAETVDQLVRLEREVLDPGGSKRWFGVRGDTGDVVALGSLVHLAGLGYVDHVVTLPEARGRGHARAVVTRMVHEARNAGVARTFLLVDPHGPVSMYERMGFREGTRIASTLATRQTGGGR